MFQVEFILVSPDPLRLTRLPYIVDLLYKELSDICNPIKAGATVLCAPSKDSLIIIYTSFNENKQLNVFVRIQSMDAESIVQIVDKISKKVKQEGYVITLSNTSLTFA